MKQLLSVTPMKLSSIKTFKGLTMIMREQLFKEYTDWVNNYLTVEVFAEHRGLTVAEGQILIDLAQSCFENNHPES